MNNSSPFPSLKTFPLVGRIAELAKLKTAWQETKDGRGKFIILNGESGVGKTRLASELATSIKGEGEILFGRCIEFGMTLPYRLFTDPLREYFKKAVAARTDIRPLIGSRPAEVIGFIPEIAEAGIEVGESVTISDAGAKYRFFEELTQVFVMISKQKPVFLILDDLQWSDRLSREFLEYLAGNIAENPIFLCATWRPEGTTGTPPFERAETIELVGLSYPEIQNFLAAALDTTDIPPGFAQSIYRQSGGNPFYIEEILKSLIANEVLKYENGWRFPDLTVDTTPATLTGVISHRLEKLDPGTRAILSQAALIGQQFSFDLLLPITGHDQKYLEDVLEQAIISLIIREEPGILEMKYGFVHELIRKVLRESIPAPQLPSLHQRIAETIETMYRYRLDDVLSDLAFHYSHTSNRVKAIEYLKRAGDYASTHYANDEAIRIYNKVLDLTSDREIFEKLGRLYSRIGNYDQAIIYFDRAFPLCTTAEQQAPMLRQLGETYERLSRYSTAITLFEEGLRKLGDHISGEKATINNALAWVYYYQGQYDQAHAHCARARATPAIAERDKADTYYIEAMIQTARGEPALALEHYQQALSIFERIGDITGSAAVYNNITAIYASRGEYATSLEYLTKYLETANRIGDPLRSAIAFNNFGEIYTILNDSDQALHYLHRAQVISARINDPMGLGWANESLGRLHHATGDWKAAAENCRQALEIFQRLGSKSKEHSTLSLLAELELEQGRIENAEKLADTIASYAESAHVSFVTSSAYLTKAKIALLDPDRWGEAERYLELVIGATRDDKLVLLAAYHQLGRLFSLQRKNPEALTVLNQAESIIDGIATNLPTEAMRLTFLQKREIQQIKKLTAEVRSKKTGRGTG